MNKYEMQCGRGQHLVTFWDGALMGHGVQTVKQRLEELAVDRLTKCLYEVGLHRLVPFIKANRAMDVQMSDLLGHTDDENLLLVCRAWWLSTRSDPRMEFADEHEVLEWYLRSSGRTLLRSWALACGRHVP